MPNSGVTSYVARAPLTSNNFILVHFGVNLTANYPTLHFVIFCSLRNQLVQMSTTHSFFNQYCISHKTISYRAAAARNPEAHRDLLSSFAPRRNKSWQCHCCIRLYTTVGCKSVASLRLVSRSVVTDAVTIFFPQKSDDLF